MADCVALIEEAGIDPGTCAPDVLRLARHFVTREAEREKQRSLLAMQVLDGMRDCRRRIDTLLNEVNGS